MSYRRTSATTLTRIKRTCRHLGITQREIAAEAATTSKRGHVGRSLVAHVFAGRALSRNVVEAARRCIHRARTERA